MTVGLQQEVKCIAQFLGSTGDHVRQVSILRLIPNVFDGIEFRRVRGKPFDMKPVSTLALQLGDCRAMSSQAVTDEREWPTQVSVNLPHEANEVASVSVMVQQFIVQTDPTSPWCACDNRHRRYPFVAMPHVLHRCQPLGGPDSAAQGLQKIATFIEKNNTSIAFEALFLSAANLRGSSERWRAHRARVHAEWVFGESSQSCEAIETCSPDETGYRRAERSCREPAARSIPTKHSPNAQFLATRPKRASFADLPRAWACVPDGALPAACSHVAMPSSSETRKRHSNQLPQLLLLRSCPARTVGLRSSDEPRALRDFQMVSYTHCSG